MYGPHHLLRQSVSLDVLAGEDGLPDLRQDVLRLRVVPVARARPTTACRRSVAGARGRRRRTPSRRAIRCRWAAPLPRCLRRSNTRGAVGTAPGQSRLRDERDNPRGGTGDRPPCATGGPSQHRQRLNEPSSCEREQRCRCVHAAVCLVGVPARRDWSSRSIPAIRSVRNAITTTTAASSIRFLLTSR